MEKEIRWYAVTSSTYTEWDRGSYSIVEATDILKEAIADGEDDAVIAVINEGDEDEDICYLIEEIALEDAERVAKAAIREACVAVMMEINNSDSIVGGTSGCTIEEWYVDDTPEELEARTEKDMAESMIDTGDAPEYKIIDGAIVFQDLKVAYVEGELYAVSDDKKDGHIVVLDQDFRKEFASATSAEDHYYVVEKGITIDLGSVWESDREWADEM